MQETFEFQGTKVIGIKDANKKIPMQKFKFDKVFKPEDDQETVFDEVKEVVNSALDGYDVCIFAYG